jgi:multiple sugar transport system substrate-binding protein
MHISKLKKILFLALTSGLILSSCNSETPRIKLVEWYELSSEAVLNPNENITIKFWHRMGAESENLVKGWIDEFKLSYPNITVLQEKAGSDYAKLADRVALAIAAGGEPDIVESYPDHVARYAQADSPLALNNFINHPTLGWSQSEIEDFLPTLWEEGLTYDNSGTILSLPFAKSTEGFFYNASYFATHNYDVPTTWEEVFTIAQDIKTREPLSIPFGYDSEDNLFITGSEQWGAPYTSFSDSTGQPEILFNNATTKEMVKYFKDKVDRGLMLTRSLNGDAYTSDIFKTNQKLYMFVGSTGGTRYAYPENSTEFNKGFRVGVAQLPSKDASKKAQIQQGPNITLLRKDNEQQMIAAWLFAKFMTSPEKSAEFSVPSGYTPTRYSSYETSIWSDYVSRVKTSPTTITEARFKLIKEAVELFLENEDAFFTSTVFNLSSKTRTEVGALLVKILAYDGPNLQNYIDSQFQDSYDFIVN